MKNNIYKVFAFSFIQNVKSKVFIILTLVCGVLMFFLTPTMIYMSEDMTSTEDTTIKKVYIVDDNNILKNTKAIKKNGTKIKGFEEIKFYLIKDKFNSYKDKFADKEENKSSILVHAYSEKNMYQLDMYKTEETSVTEQDLAMFSEQMAEFYNDNKIENMKLDTKSYSLIKTPMNLEIHVDGENDSDFQSEQTIMMIVMMVMMFFVVLSGENISTQIVNEKSTKLVEYLLVNIRPLDLVCGKVLASVLVSLVQMLVMIGAGLSSIVFSKKIGLIESYDETLGLLKLGKFTDELSAIDVTCILLYVIIGFLFYAIIACMLASLVSRLEDLSNVQMIYSIIILIVMYAIMGILAVTEMNTANVIYKVLMIVPFTSIFVAPQLVMLGKMSVDIIVISLVAQGVFLFIFGKIAAKIYVSLIMYSGKKVNLKQLYAMVFSKKMQSNS